MQQNRVSLRKEREISVSHVRWLPFRAVCIGDYRIDEAKESVNSSGMGLRISDVRCKSRSFTLRLRETIAKTDSKVCDTERGRKRGKQTEKTSSEESNLIPDRCLGSADATVIGRRGFFSLRRRRSNLEPM